MAPFFYLRAIPPSFQHLLMVLFFILSYWGGRLAYDDGIFRCFTSTLSRILVLSRHSILLTPNNKDAKNNIPM